MQHRFWGATVVLSVLLLAASAAFAQSSSTADLEGTITDSADAVVPGAQLTVTNIETGVKRTGVSNDIGRYRISALPAGEYQLSATKAGFATVERKGLVLQIGQLATVDFNLPVASQTQTINISEAAPMIETDQVRVGAVVDQKEIGELPIDGRNFLDFSQTVAGVTDSQTSGQGSGISFNGQRQRSNNISIDGADNNGQLNGNVRLTLSQDAVREFQVVTNLFSPEFGNASGGLINVVSKSGTNAWHGGGFFYYRNESLDGRNAFVTSADKPPFQRKTVGATLGGPLVRNRTFFFSAVDYTKRHESDVVTISDASLARINAVLARRPIPRSLVKALSNGAFPIDQIDTLSSIKVDHVLTSKDNLSVRYSYGQDRQSNAGGVAIGGTTDVSGGGGQRMRDQSVTTSLTHVFSPTLLSETRFQFAPRAFTQYANDLLGPRVTITSTATWGRSSNFPVLLDEGRRQLTETISKQAGRHFFKFGGDINWVRAHTSYPVNFGGTFTFSSLTAFEAGTVNQFTQGFGNPDIHLPDTMIGIYAQDNFKISRKFDLVYGFRYDYEVRPQGYPRDPKNPIEAPLQTGIHRDPKNIAPRLGVTFTPDGKGKTVIRTGYGMFYDKVFLLVARNALIARQSLTLATAQATAQLAVGAFPQSGSFPTGFSLPKGSLNSVDDNLATPYAHQVNFGIERALAGNWAVSATYVFVRGVHGLRAQNINLGPPIILTAANAASLGVSAPTQQQIGRPVYPANDRLNPNFDAIYQVNTTSNSIYNGLQLALTKRFSRGFQMRVNYSRSKVMDDATDFTQAQQPADPYTPRAEWARSTEDQAQRFTLTGVWDLPYRHASKGNPVLKAAFADWVLATNWTFVAGLPQNITTGSDSNLDTNSNDRPFNGVYTLGRNTWEAAGRAVVNVRLSKYFQIHERLRAQVLGEAFNVENRVNYNGMVSTWGNNLAAKSTLGNYTSSGNPRQVQLGLRFSF
jgi:hypothetical protein